MAGVSTSKHTATSLSHIASVLDSAAKQLRVCSETMEDREIDVVVVKYQKELERGMKGVTGFSHAAFNAVHEALQDKGHFVAPQEQLEKKIRMLEADLEKAKARIKELEG